MKNYIHDGNTAPYVCEAAVKSGDVIVQSGRHAIAKSNGAIGETIALQLTGVVRIPKADGVAFTQFAVVNWVPGDGTANSTGGAAIGIAWEPAAAGDDFVSVKLPG